jgi:hypothetical protein
MAQPLIESLESRRFLSATGMFSPTQYAHAVPETVRSVPKVVKPVAIDSDVLIGSYTGTVKFSKFFVSKKFSLSIEITDQTLTSITGTVTIDGHTYSGSFNGKYYSNRTFTYSLKDGKSQSVSFNGTLNAAGTYASGKVTAKYKSWSVSGTFEFHRTA